MCLLGDTLWYLCITTWTPFAFIFSVQINGSFLLTALSWCFIKSSETSTVSLAPLNPLLFSVFLPCAGCVFPCGTHLQKWHGGLPKGPGEALDILSESSAQLLSSWGFILLLWCSAVYHRHHRNQWSAHCCGCLHHTAQQVRDEQPFIKGRSRGSLLHWDWCLVIQVLETTFQILQHPWFSSVCFQHGWHWESLQREI